MGFSLLRMFEELKDILNEDMKAAKKIKLIERVLREKRRYAEECGQLK